MKCKTFALYAKDTYIKGWYSDCIQIPLKFMSLLKNTSLHGPCPSGDLQGVSLLQILSFFADPYQLLSRKSFICHNPDVIWAEIQRLIIPGAIGADADRFSVHLTCGIEFLPALGEGSDWPLHGIRSGDLCSTPCFHETGRKLMSSRFSPLSNVTDLSEQIK